MTQFSSIMTNLQPCIVACRESTTISREAAAECFKSHETREVALLLLDNAKLGEITVEVLARNSRHLSDFCRLNSHINRLAAAECARVAQPSELLIRCRQACLRCAEECEKNIASSDF